MCYRCRESNITGTVGRIVARIQANIFWSRSRMELYWAHGPSCPSYVPDCQAVSYKLTCLEPSIRTARGCPHRRTRSSTHRRSMRRRYEVPRPRRRRSHADSKITTSIQTPRRFPPTAPSANERADAERPSAHRYGASPSEVPTGSARWSPPRYRVVSTFQS